MPNENTKQKWLWNRLVHQMDGLLVPIAFGSLCVLIFAQLLMQVPEIRSVVDRAEGRFISQPVDVVPATVIQESANVNLFLSPVTPHPNVLILKNGKVVGNFADPNVTVQIREGDVLGFAETNGGHVYITVDQDDTRLFLPAPGQVVELTSQQPSNSLPHAEFTN